MRATARMLAMVAFAVTAVTWVAASTPAGAAGGSPTIAVDRASVHAGDRVIVTFDGWRARNAVVTVCGDLARRGAADCAMEAAAGVTLDIGAPRMITELVVPLPPSPCPCVVEASSLHREEVAFAPIDLLGAAVAPLVPAATESAVDLRLRVAPDHRGLGSAVRAALGGPAWYRVEATVSNHSPEPVAAVAMTGDGGRTARDIGVSFDLPAVGSLAPGATKTVTARVRRPSPSFGTYRWTITASGAGPAVHDATTTRNRPLGFVALVGVLAGDLVLILRRRQRGAGRRAAFSRGRTAGGGRAGRAAPASRDRARQGGATVSVPS